MTINCKESCFELVSPLRENFLNMQIICDIASSVTGFPSAAHTCFLPTHVSCPTPGVLHYLWLAMTYVIAFPPSWKQFLLLHLLICYAGVSLQLLLATSFCLDDSLEWKKEHQLRPWFLHVKSNALRESSTWNIFGLKTCDSNFSHYLFGILINAN